MAHRAVLARLSRFVSWHFLSFTCISSHYSPSYAVQTRFVVFQPASACVLDIGHLGYPAFSSMVLGILFNHNDCRRENTFLDDYFLEKYIIYKESFLLSLQFCSPPSSVSLSWCRSCSKSVCPSVCVSFCLSVCLCLFLGICLNIIDNISLFLGRSLPI